MVGCYDYDCLQRSDWCSATWYRTHPFIASAVGPVVNFERTARAAGCLAKMDDFNHDNMSPATSTGPVADSFRAVPGGASIFASVTCKRVAYTVTNEIGSRTGGRLDCTDARVRVLASGAMTVTVTLAR